MEDVMSVETKKILEMLAAGKITSEDAERLLDKLTLLKDQPEDKTVEAATGLPKSGAAQKYLRIVVTRDHGREVNMRVPLSFLRSGVQLAGVLPLGLAEKLNEHGFDVNAFSHMPSAQLNETLSALNMNIDTDGNHVHIFCE
jgi:hypothetical protein